MCCCKSKIVLNKKKRLKVYMGVIYLLSVCKDIIHVLPDLLQ